MKIIANTKIALIINCGNYQSKPLIATAEMFDVVGVSENLDTHIIESDLGEDYISKCHDEYLMGFGSYDEFAEEYDCEVKIIK